MFYLPNTPLWLRLIFPSGVIWKGDPTNKTIYLTFDDGPEPEVTQFVLDELEKYNIKATFFCIGDNVAKHPETFEKVKAAGHRVGNHTMHHPNGWKTKDAAYVAEVMEANKLIQSDLFRPPYGKITKGQARELRSKELVIGNWGKGKRELGIRKGELGIGEEGLGNAEQKLEIKELGNGEQQLLHANHTSQITDHRFKIIMWSVIAGDFDEKIDGDVCYSHILKYTTPGSIIVFHDSYRAFPRLKVALPKTLEWLKQQGFRTEVIG